MQVAVSLMRHVTKLCGEKKNLQNSDLINCLIPGNRRIQGGMDLGEKKNKNGECVREDGLEGEREIHKDFLSSPWSQNPQGNVPINMGKIPTKTTEGKDPLRGRTDCMEESVKSLATRKGKKKFEDFIHTLNFFLSQGHSC